MSWGSLSGSAVGLLIALDGLVHRTIDKGVGRFPLRFGVLLNAGFLTNGHAEGDPLLTSLTSDERALRYITELGNRLES